MTHRFRLGVHRGISLIEAVVALAVMAFGLVAIVGLQGTLRGNSDVSKQRAEAVRLAQEEIERWRAFVSLQAGPGVDYTDIANVPPVNVGGTNATYVVTKRVPNVVAPAPKTVTVNVAWTDRKGQARNVSLNSSIAGVSPELAGALMLPQNSGKTQPVNGRNTTIPGNAKNFGDGTSGFVPPQRGGPKVAWVFNNLTGMIVRTCTVAYTATTSVLTAADVAANLASCNVSTSSAQLLSGYVNFADTATQPDEVEAEAPSGTALNMDVELVLGSAYPNHRYACFDDSPEAPESLPRPVAYFCAVYSSPEMIWSGRLRVVPLAFNTPGAVPWTIGLVNTVDASQRIVCRYTTLTTDGTATDRNSAGPLDYRLDGSARGASLRDQNFLVIKGPHSCPVDTLSASDQVNSNTRWHQTGIAPYL